MPRLRLTKKLRVETLEEKQCLSASLGWDGAGQGGADLTYYLGDVPASLDREVVESALEEAFEAWAEVADVTFTETSQSGLFDSIDITFAAIDGAGGTLAQAYFPDDVNPARIAGDIVFDLVEAWEVGNALGGAAFDLVYVAAHEIGHSLGLEHSDDADSVLQDTVSATQTFTGLSASDIAEALEVYAPAMIDPVVPTDESQDPLTPSTEVPGTEIPEVTPTEPTDGSDNDPSETPTTDPEETPTRDNDADRGRRFVWRRWFVFRWSPWADSHANDGPSSFFSRGGAARSARFWR